MNALRTSILPMKAVRDGAVYLESYTLQTPVSWWIFACIFIGIAFVIALSIGYRVWKAANENPADVVKSE